MTKSKARFVTVAVSSFPRGLKPCVGSRTLVHVAAICTQWATVQIKPVILETTQPFSFPLTASVLARLPQHNQVECFDETNGIHQRAIHTSTGTRVVTAREHPKGLELNDDSPEAREWAIMSFGLNLDPMPFYKVAARDSALSSATKSLTGLRPPLMTPWEAWVAAILGQQITLSFCLQQINMVSRRFGGEVVGQIADGSSYLFPLHPSPEQIVAADEAGLLECKVSRRKTEYLKTVARALLDGYFDGVLEGDVREILEHLTALRGVGLWTARYWLAAIGRLDFLAYGDAGLNAAYKTAYGSLDGIEAWGEALGATRGWAYYYLIWHTKYMK
jgi:3-methyladenine DNA glycosylase/8-oxoguanine DNA glycosylase